MPMASLRLKITGMSCAHCQMSVEKALAKVPGVFAAVVDLKNAFAEVDYDDDTATLEELTAAVAKAGYVAAVVG
jgi:copper chaperone CopZ